MYYIHVECSIYKIQEIHRYIHETCIYKVHKKRIYKQTDQPLILLDIYATKICWLSLSHIHWRQWVNKARTQSHIHTAKSNSPCHRKQQCSRFSVFFFYFSSPIFINFTLLFFKLEKRSILFIWCKTVGWRWRGTHWHDFWRSWV